MGVPYQPTANYLFIATANHIHRLQQRNNGPPSGRAAPLNIITSLKNRWTL